MLEGLGNACALPCAACQHSWRIPYGLRYEGSQRAGLLVGTCSVYWRM